MTVSRLRLLVDCQGKSTIRIIRHTAIQGRTENASLQGELFQLIGLAVIGRIDPDQRNVERHAAGLDAFRETEQLVDVRLIAEGAGVPAARVWCPSVCRPMR